jgi:hypothetical protein
MVIRKEEFKKDPRRITYRQAREHTETSTRKVDRSWKAVGQGENVKR